MFLDVVDLRNFYSQPLGIVGRRLLSQAIRARWPNTRGLTLVGLGYATPYLGVFRDEVERTFALMPSRQGVVKWPTAVPSLSALVEDTQLPLPDASVDRVLAVHALEMTIHAPDMLREVWRVLAAGAHRYDAVRARPAVLAPSAGGIIARGAVHAGRMGRGAVDPAAHARAVPADSDRLGARRPHAFAPLRRRSYRGSDEAGLASDSGAARAQALTGVEYAIRRRVIFLREHDLFRKPVPIFRDHALIKRGARVETPPARRTGSRTTRAHGIAPAVRGY